MKKNLTVLILFLSEIALGQNISKQLENDSLINKYFNKNDIESISILVESYDKFVIAETGEKEINSAYHLFFGVIENCNSNTEFIEKISLPKNDLDSIISVFDRNNSLTTFWELEINRRKNQLDTISISLKLNLLDKYWKYLNELAEKEPFINEYQKTIQKYNGITPTQIAWIGKNHDKFDFTETHWKLFFAIHSMTITYHETYNKISL